MHIQKLILPLALCLSLCIPAYATGDDAIPDTTPEEVTSNESTSVENPDDYGMDSGGDSGSAVDYGDSLYDDANLVGVELYSLSPVTPDDAVGLKSVLLEFVGNYDPVIVEYEYQNSNNNYSSYLREVQPDYVWLASCGMLALFVLSLFKLGGAILCRR